MKKSELSEILKCVIYAVLGLGIGAAIASGIPVIFKVIISLSMLCLLVVLTIFHVVSLGKGNSAPKQTVHSTIPVPESSQVQRVQRTEQKNALDAKPMSAEKREIHNKNKVPATKIVLINEEGTSLLSWSLQSKTSLIIGKSTEKEPVDIDLSGTAVAQMISKQHAVLNYTEKGWYIDDIDSKNGTRVKKATQNTIMDIKLVGAVEVEPGDIIYIANAVLQIQ